MTKGETGIFPCRSVKEMDGTKSSQLRREKKKPMVLEHEGLKSGLKSRPKGLKHAQQQELHCKFGSVRPTLNKCKTTLSWCKVLIL